ncbi:hypothetical protein [Streptomyces canus]|uniref:hypothetical protein n=1 Tax=Streptomyces canus TaxID=58343 RepID=UPI00386BAB20
MVTSAHEGMHRIFQERPEILGFVFEVLGVPLSAKATVDAVTTDVTETRPLERRVDTVLRIGPSDGEDFLLAIESQSGRVAGRRVGRTTSPTSRRSSVCPWLDGAAGVSAGGRA